MLHQDGSRMTISSQLFRLIETHGLENIIDALKVQCYMQVDLTACENLNGVISRLEDSLKFASKTSAWK
jgi:hypothetical protein